MIDFFAKIPIIWVALLAGMFCLFCTTIGALMVFFIKNNNAKFMNSLLTFAGGIMISASIFGLLLPALNLCAGNVLTGCLFVVGGFFIGGFFIILSNNFIEKKLKYMAEKSINQSRRNILLVSAITVHNIPEGLAVGVAFASVIATGDITLLSTAILLAIGIGIQNIPEGTSVVLPLKRDNVSSKRAFFIGFLSGVVEPIFALLGCLLFSIVVPILPLLLSFSAGAMIVVACAELIPEALNESKTRSITYFILGFCLMAVLDIVLG